VLCLAANLSEARNMEQMNIHMQWLTALHVLMQDKVEHGSHLLHL
jgi:hypothetical protein